MQLSSYIHMRSFIWSSNLIGLAFICIFAYQDIEDKASTHSASVYRQLNSMMSEVKDLYSTSFKDIHLPEDCPLFTQQATNTILNSSVVRSVSWVYQKTLLCSSLPNYQSVSLSPKYSAAQHQQIFFVPQTIFSVNSQIVEKGVVLITIPVSNEHYIYFGIHPQHLMGLLENVEANFNSYLKLGDYIFSRSSISQVQMFKKLAKPRYSNDLFQVYYQYSLKTYLQYLFNKFGILIALWLIISTVGARAVYNYIDTFNWLSFSISRAIKNKHFTAYLQPVFDASGLPIGGEVLVRWQHPNKGLILPSDFVGVAEKTGQISAISGQLFQQVSIALNNIPEVNRKPLHIAFNICPIQLTEPVFFTDCQHFIENFAKYGYVLIVELTEREELPNGDEYLVAIERLKSIGVKMALDDFGTGHCSLKYLHQIDTDYLKIDRSFVQAIHDAHKIELLENIIDLAQRLKVQTIAEGIEQQCELDFLLSRGVNYYQGHYFDGPLALAAFIQKYG